MVSAGVTLLLVSCIIFMKKSSCWWRLSYVLFHFLYSFIHPPFLSPPTSLLTFFHFRCSTLYFSPFSQSSCQCSNARHFWSIISSVVFEIHLFYFGRFLCLCRCSSAESTIAFCSSFHLSSTLPSPLLSSNTYKWTPCILVDCLLP